MPRRRDVPLGVFVPGTSPIHRAAPHYKLIALFAFILACTLLATTPLRALAALLCAAAGVALARIPLRMLAGQLASPLFILVPLAGFQWWAKDFDYAAALFLSILASIIAAFIVSLTTGSGELLEGVETLLRPFGRLGLPVENISLALALTLRMIPVMFATVYEVLDARQARGAGLSPLAFGTPVLIRSIRRARALGEALQARGVGDE